MIAEMFQTPTRALPLAFIPPCIPTWSRHAPVGRDWVHEIKHDGYRLMVRRQGAQGAIVHAPRVRLVAQLPYSVAVAPMSSPWCRASDTSTRIGPF